MNYIPLLIKEHLWRPGRTKPRKKWHRVLKRLLKKRLGLLLNLMGMLLKMMHNEFLSGVWLYMI